MKKLRFDRFIAIILIIAVFFCGFCFNVSFADDETESVPVSFDLSMQTGALPPSSQPTISASSAIVMEMESGRVLYGKNERVKKPMASTTKIMTAIVALENGNLNDIVKVSKRAASIRGSIVGLQEGKEYSLKALLYGMMLSSGNDAAIAVAEHIGGSVENFVAMMNKKAAELNAFDTSFENPHGLDSENHYSTAYDMALITRYALKNETFARIVGTVNMNIGDFSLYNTNEMLTMYNGADGVKTGYTGKAGRCLVTSAERDGMKLISVVLGCPSRKTRAESSKKILDYAFENYKIYKLVDKGEFIDNLDVKKGKSKQVAIRAAKSIKIPLTEEEYNNMESMVWLPSELKAPVYAGSDIGNMRFLVNGRIIADTELKIWEDVKKKTTADYLLEIFRTWGAFMKYDLRLLE